MGKQSSRRNGNRSNNSANEGTRVAAIPPQQPPEPEARNERESPLCFHLLTEEEYDSPEMYHYADIFNRYMAFHGSHRTQGIDSFQVFWDRPENKAYVDNNMIRLLFFKATQQVITKEDMGPEYMDIARSLVRIALDFAGAIKCCSVRAFHEAETQAIEEGVEVDREILCFLSAFNIIKNLVVENDLRFLYLLYRMSRCNCLMQDIHQLEQQLERDNSPDARFVCCVCDKREEVPQMYKLCSRCGIRCYCSTESDRECQRIDWRQSEMKHKHVCPLIREILKCRVKPLHESVE